MLRLRLGTTYLDLDPDGSLDLNIVNPLFDRDGAEALYSFPFKLPATARNLHALSHANRLDSASNTTTYTGAVLEVDGLPFEPDGVLDLDGQAFTADSITAVFRNQADDIIREFELLKLDDIMETVGSQEDRPAQEWKFLAEEPPTLYEIVIGGTAYQVTYAESSSLAIYQVLQLLVTRINADIPGMAVSTFSLLILDGNLVTSHPVNGWNNAFSVLEVVTPSLATYTGFMGHLDAVNATPIASHAFPQVKWPDFYNGNNALLFRGWVNPWINGEHIENVLYDTPEWAATYVPFVRVPYIFSRILASQSLVLGIGGELDGPDIQALLQFNNRSLDAVSQDFYDDVTQKYLNHFTEEIDLNQHVPKMTAAQYFRAFLDSFQFYYRIVGRYIYLVKKRDMLASQPLDWTALGEPGYSAVRNRREGFRIEYADSPDEHVATGQLEPFTGGDGRTIVPLPFSTPCMFTGTSQKGIVEVKCPVVKQPGSSDHGGVGKNDPGFRFLFDRGLQPASNGEDYPMGSHDATNYDGDAVGSLSLDLNASDGLYHLHHKGILELLADGQPVTLAMRLSIADLLDVRKWANARRTIVLPEGQVTAVIKSIKVKAGRDGLGISIVEFVQEK
jgi:hypothetical protein